MLSVEEIAQTALAEHDQAAGASSSSTTFPLRTQHALQAAIPLVTSSSLSSPAPEPRLVRFRCMLQDTGYPPEVYMPPFAADEEPLSTSSWSRLKERWVGWAVAIPGEQPWVRHALAGDDNGETLADTIADMQLSPQLPADVLRKFPSGPPHVGMLIKVYDPDASFSPGSTHTFTGLLSTSPMPSTSDDQDDPALVPCLHVLTPPEPLLRPPLPVATLTRDAAIQHLAAVLGGDTLAAECLLLSLVGRVTGRAAASSTPLGSLSVGLLIPKEGSTSFAGIASALGDLVESVNPLPLTLDALKSGSFFPSAMDSSSGLCAGTLQLPPGALLLVDEDALEPGTLDDRGVRNLRALSELFKSQRLRYAYPYVAEDFGMECDVTCVAVGQGKSLLPVDVHVPLLPTDTAFPSAALPLLRSFLRDSRDAASTVAIPDDVAEHIQVDWVRRRKEGGGGKAGVGELDLARWLRMARLMAQTYPDHQLTPEIWRRTVELDEERQRRMAARS